MLTTRAPGKGRGDPAIRRLHLEPGVIVLHHQGQVAGILVGTYPRPLLPSGCPG